MKTIGHFGILFCGLLGLSVPAWAGPVPEHFRLPHDGGGKFLGVQTCGSSTCHGSAEPWRNATVSMKERFIWEQHDPHSKAFSVLESKLGKQIARNLNINATGDPLCLGCHTSFIPAERQSSGFSLSNGIQCESCHGAGNDFLRAHVQPASTHALNVQAGMFPTENAAARAELCLSCHRGDDRRELLHNVYAAGHPRLRFELDTFSVNQPYHYVQDADYRKRKKAAGHVKLWIQGQLKTARNTLRRIEKLSSEATPDFSNFDCSMCHHSTGADEERGPRPGLEPGQPYFDDAALVLLRAVARVVAPAQREELLQKTRALQTGLEDPERRAAELSRLKASLGSLEERIKAQSPGDKDSEKLISGLVSEYFAESPLTYIAAENFAMSLAALVESAHDSKTISEDRYRSYKRAIDRLYAALKAEDRYQPAALQPLFEELRDVARGK